MQGMQCFWYTSWLVAGCINVQSPVNFSQPPSTLSISVTQFPHVSSLCASYLCKLFSAVIRLSLAQVFTSLLKQRLMRRALLLSSLLFSLVTALVLTATFHLSKLCFCKHNTQSDRYGSLSGSQNKWKKYKSRIEIKSKCLISS